MLPCTPSKNCIHPEWGKGLRKTLWIPHIQVIPFLNFCHLAGATEPQIPGQPGTRTVSSPRQSTLWKGKLFPHYGIYMCNNLIFICYHLHPSKYLHLILFYSIISSKAQLYIQYIYFSFFCLFIYVYFFNLILYVFSVCSCLCVLETYVTKTKSLYAQTYLAIKLFLILITWVFDGNMYKNKDKLYSKILHTGILWVAERYHSDNVLCSTKQIFYSFTYWYSLRCRQFLLLLMYLLPQQWCRMCNWLQQSDQWCDRKCSLLNFRLFYHRSIEF